MAPALSSLATASRERAREEECDPVSGRSEP